MTRPEPYATIDVACPVCGSPLGRLNLYAVSDLPTLGVGTGYVQAPETECPTCCLRLRAVVSGVQRAGNGGATTHRVVLAPNELAVDTPLGWI